MTRKEKIRLIGTDTYEYLIRWREQHISQKNFIILLSFVVGIVTAIAAILLKNLIHFIQGLLQNHVSVEHASYLYLIFPAVGILLASLFVRFFVKDDISHGITKILFAISQRKARIKPHNMWSSVVASALTIGFGGSVGAEAPIVLTGSAIGSNLGRFFKMDQKTLMLMVGCGAAGAIAGIFNAPIAGVVFTLEVLMVDMTMTSLIPLLISAVTATSISYFFMGKAAMFQFEATAPFALSRIPYLLILGVVCGLVSLYFTRGMNACENLFRKMTNSYTKLVVGGVVLSVLIFFLPSLYGEGYTTISFLLNEHPDKLLEGSFFYEYRNVAGIVFLYLFLTILFKIVATSATNGAGGTGGIFAPSLFVGAITGFLVAHVLIYFGVPIPARNFALAGMAGVMSAVMHAPLTGIFLIAEITSGYNLFMPLMITSVVAYLTIVIFEPHSLYSMRLAKKGELITHHKDKAVLTMLTITDVIETNMQVVNPNMTLREFVAVIPQSKRNIFPVVDEDGVFVGAVHIDEIRNILFRQELYDRFYVKRFMTSPPAHLLVEDTMEKAMSVFDRTNAWNLPVIDAYGRYVGYVSKSRIFGSYREILVKYSDD